MKNKKKIFIVFGSILLGLICYREYCFYQTRNIYNEFEKIYIDFDFNNHDINLEYDVNCIDYDSKKYGTNRKGYIKKWRPYIFGNEGSIGCYVTIDFYDEDNNIIHSSNYFNYDNLILIKKVNNIWIIDHIRTMN